jgi:hypothetical protein
MPVIPEDTPEPMAEEAPVRKPRTNRLLGVCFAIFTFQVGVFLVVFPWTDTWNLNYFQGLVPALQDIWDHPYFRGAVTGLGLLNVYLAGLETIRLLKRA